MHDIVRAFEHRSTGALISVFALLAAMPVIGAIPGMTITTATLILLVLAQSLFTRHGGLWIPHWLGRRTMRSSTLRNAVEKSRPYVGWIDRWLHPRLTWLTWLTRGRTQRLAMVITLALLTVSMYPLNLIPFGVEAPSFGILALALAPATGDGMLALTGYALVLVTIGVAVYLLV